MASYFILTFAVSWGLAFLVASPFVLRGEAIPYFDGIIMFPALLVGPSATGIVLTRIVDGKAGLAGLRSRMGRVRVGIKWYAVAFLVPPVLILAVLSTLSSFVSPVFTPHILVYGIAFGVLAGYLEEIGWTGYAYHKMSAKHGALQSALLLGMIWGLWHAPVVDFLGAAYPHGAYWLPFYLAFIAVVMALRVIIVWIYSSTQSVLLAQATHGSSTGFLAFFGPLTVSAGQEAAWYAAYALALWVVALVIIPRGSLNLVETPEGSRLSDIPA